MDATKRTLTIRVSSSSHIARRAVSYTAAAGDTVLDLPFNFFRSYVRNTQKHSDAIEQAEVLDQTGERLRLDQVLSDLPDPKLEMVVDGSLLRVFTTDTEPRDPWHNQWETGAFKRPKLSSDLEQADYAVAPAPAVKLEHPAGAHDAGDPWLELEYMLQGPQQAAPLASNSTGLVTDVLGMSKNEAAAHHHLEATSKSQRAACGGTSVAQPQPIPTAPIGLGVGGASSGAAAGSKVSTPLAAIHGVATISNLAPALGGTSATPAAAGPSNNGHVPAPPTPAPVPMPQSSLKHAPPAGADGALTHISAGSNAVQALQNIRTPAEMPSQYAAAAPTALTPTKASSLAAAGPGLNPIRGSGVSAVAAAQAAALQPMIKLEQLGGGPGSHQQLQDAGPSRSALPRPPAGQVPVALAGLGASTSGAAAAAVVAGGLEGGKRISGCDARTFAQLSGRMVEQGVRVEWGMAFNDSTLLEMFGPLIGSQDPYYVRALLNTFQAIYSEQHDLQYIEDPAAYWDGKIKPQAHSTAHHMDPARFPLRTTSRSRYPVKLYGDSGIFGPTKTAVPKHANMIMQVLCIQEPPGQPRVDLRSYLFGRPWREYTPQQRMVYGPHLAGAGQRLSEGAWVFLLPVLAPKQPDLSPSFVLVPYVNLDFKCSGVSIWKADGLGRRLAAAEAVMLEQLAHFRQHGVMRTDRWASAT